MITSFIPFMRESDYPAFQKLAPGHTDFPPSYTQWLWWRTEYRASEQGHHVEVEDVDISPAELRQWCAGKAPNALTLINFAAHKAMRKS